MSDDEDEEDEEGGRVTAVRTSQTINSPLTVNGIRQSHTPKFGRVCSSPSPPTAFDGMVVVALEEDDDEVAATMVVVVGVAVRSVSGTCTAW